MPLVPEDAGGCWSLSMPMVPLIAWGTTAELGGPTPHMCCLQLRHHPALTPKLFLSLPATKVYSRQPGGNRIAVDMLMAPNWWHLLVLVSRLGQTHGHHVCSPLATL